MENNCCSSRKRERSEEELHALVSRLNRMEGQVRGIRRMLEEDAYCTDILTQTAAVSAALNAFRRELLALHIRTCVATDLREGREESTEELIATLHRLMN